MLLKQNFSMRLLGIGVLYVFSFLLCASCSDSAKKSSPTKAASKMVGCKVETKEVTENSITNLISIGDFGGSTFVACKTGVITALSFKVAAASEAQAKAMLFLSLIHI